MIKILIGIAVFVVLYCTYIAIKSGLQLEKEFDELAMVYTYNLLVIYKKHLTGKEDIKLSYESADDVGYLFNPFNFKTLLTRTAKDYIIQYFKDNYYILNEAKERWPEETADIEKTKENIEKWI